MDLIYPKNKVAPRKKFLPALGGINNRVSNKQKCLETTLICISEILSRFKESDDLKEKDKIFIEEVQKDLLKISRIKKVRKIEFYFICSEIVQKYNI